MDDVLFICNQFNLSKEEGIKAFNDISISLYLRPYSKLHCYEKVNIFKIVQDLFTLKTIGKVGA